MKKMCQYVNSSPPHPTELILVLYVQKLLYYTRIDAGVEIVEKITFLGN